MYLRTSSPFARLLGLAVTVGLLVFAAIMTNPTARINNNVEAIVGRWIIRITLKIMATRPNGNRKK